MIFRVSEDPIPTWFIEQYLGWQRDRHALSPVAEFARYLEVSNKTFGHWISGRNKPSYTSAVKICVKLRDFTLLDLLGYPKNYADEISIDFLPSDLRESMRLALAELATTLRTRSIQPDSPAAVEVSTAILAKHGFKVTEIK